MFGPPLPKIAVKGGYVDQLATSRRWSIDNDAKLVHLRQMIQGTGIALGTGETVPACLRILLPPRRYAPGFPSQWLPNTQDS